MTTFTDDDLSDYRYKLENVWAFKGDREKMKALLARLETAEGSFTSKHEEGGSEWWLDFEESKRAWRKAAGK
jgi:hypothetical protein